ncbi:MAG: phosphoribosylglycinamide formyltransferase [Verrucomicrobiales bacterium]|nr:phosphoribosylglycinamide formyltransferase [Verrucomicrobiales bacterium]
MADRYISTVKEMADLRERLESEGGRLVLTNGAFDLLHVGHVRYLNEAASLGDHLVVAMNSDASVRELKGPGRPINSAEERAEMLCALEAVDSVVEFDSLRATAVIEAINPHVYTKGGDYTVESLIDEERELLQRLGTEVRILSLVPGKSTSSTLIKLSENPQGERRIAIIGSGEGTNARAILRAAEDGRIDAKVALVISDCADSGMLSAGEEYAVPTLHIYPGTEKGGHLTDASLKEITDRMVAAGIDLIVLAGFMRIVREPLLSAFEGRILNLHPSLLPDYPGLNPVARVLKEGRPETGVTIHLVDAGVDTGEILRQETVPISHGESEASLLEKIHAVEHRIYPEVIAERVKMIHG